MRIYTVVLLLCSTVIYGKDFYINSGTLGHGFSFATEFLAQDYEMRFIVRANNTIDAGDQNGNNYKIKTKLLSGGVLLDKYINDTNFRITGGLLYNKNKFDFLSTGQNSGSFVVGNTTIPSAGASLQTSIGFRKVAPYLGIGWTSGREKEKGWLFSYALGVLFQGKPQLDLLVTDPSNTVTPSDISKAEQELKDSLSKLQYYPHIGFGISYRF